MSSAARVRAFPFKAGKPIRDTSAEVSRFVEILCKAGYSTALFAKDFSVGTFIIEINTDAGFSVSWLPTPGCEVST